MRPPDRRLSATAPLDLSVVIVNYNVRFFLEQCLHSVRRASRTLNVEVIVVDNASVDESLIMLREMDNIVLIVNEENRGFAKANNQGIAIAKGDFILLLNPDTLVPEDCFQRCLAFAKTEPNIGALGVKMLDGTGSYLPESKRGLPTPWVSFTKMSGLSRLAPGSATLNGYYLGHLDVDSTADVEVLPGAFMWLSRQALEAVGGGLDEAYFMYGEDIDLSYLIGRAGYRVVYFPLVQIIHYKGESTRKRSWHYVKAFYRAMAIFSRKHLKRSAPTSQIMLEAAIYARAGAAVASNAFARIWPILIDLVCLFAIALLIRNFWASYYFQDANYYSNSSFLEVNTPIYLLLWTIGLIFSGAYDRPFRVIAMARGLGAGTLLILLVYALLPANFRTSRAIVLLTALTAIPILGLIRLLWSLVRPGDVSLSRASVGKDKRLLIVGDENEARRALALLAQVGVARQFLGRVTPGARDDQQSIGDSRQLTSLVKAHGIDEIIFCLSNVSVDGLIRWMNELGPALDYRTLAPGAQAVVGSPSRHQPGELYAFTTSYAIATPGSRRTKRSFDLIVCLFILVFFPVTMFVDRPGRLWRNILYVGIGSATWVGYGDSGQGADSLPRIRPCVLPQGDQQQSAAAVAKTNELYAKHWRVQDDLRLVLKSWRKLGSEINIQPKVAPARWPLSSATTMSAAKL